jgi:hypothetical protein
MPDNDQRRMAAPGILGLPGNGNNHCVPTSCMNVFEFFANHGIPQLGVLDGPHDWQSNANYERVTAAIQFLGNLMGTSSTTGTTGSGGYNGAKFYLALFAPGRVVVVKNYCPNYGPTPWRMFLATLLGGYIAPCYGRYSVDMQGRYTRTGGHCITLNTLTDACQSYATIGFRDPASDSANTTQSAFLTQSVNVYPVTAQFRGSDTSSFINDTRWRIAGYNTPSFLDSWYNFMPAIGVTFTFTDAPMLKLMRPFRLEGSPLPAEENVPPPAGFGPLRDVAMEPSLLGEWFITGPLPLGQCTLHRMDPYTHESQPVLTGPDLTGITFNRFGEMVLCDGSVLKAFDVGDPTMPPRPLGQVSIGTAPEAMAADDATDSVGVIIPPGTAGRRLARFDRALGRMASSPFLPQVTLNGRLSLAFDADGALFLGSDGFPAIYRMVERDGVLLLTHTIPLPAGVNPSGINIGDDGHIVFVGGGVLREYQEDPSSGRYIPSPTSLFAGLQAGPQFFLARSRTGHIPAEHEGPGWYDLIDPEQAPGIPDCYANCDGSTGSPALNVNDFICFQSRFARGDGYADCDHSGTLNVNDFICFQGAFAAGCP